MSSRSLEAILVRHVLRVSGERRVVTDHGMLMTRAVVANGLHTPCHLTRCTRRSVPPPCQKNRLPRLLYLLCMSSYMDGYITSGLERSILEDRRVHLNSKAFESALASQSTFQLGLLLVLPMVMELGLEKGFQTAIGEFVIMQLQLASVFFILQLGTKAHYYGRTILHRGAKYRVTGRGFVVFHAKFSDNYRMYSRIHFVKGLELMILLVVYEVYGHSYRSSTLYLFVNME